MCKVAIFGLLLSISCSLSSTFANAYILNDVREVVTNKTITDEMVRQLLEMAKEYIPDNLDIADQHILRNNSDYYLKADIQNLTIKGLNEFMIEKTHADMSKPEIGAKISFGIVNATGQYDLLADTNLFKIFGNGSASANLSGVVISANIVLGTNEDKTVKVADIVLKYNATSMQVRFNNLVGGGETCDTINDLINIALPDIINEEIGNVEILLKGFLNDKFKFLAMTMDELIDFINMILGN